MKARIDLFDTSFILHSDEDNEYIQTLVGHIRSRIDAISEDVSTNGDQLKKAILTLLLVTHEQFLLKKELKSTNNYALSSVRKMIHLLNDSVSRDNPQPITLDPHEEPLTDDSSVHSIDTGMRDSF